MTESFIHTGVWFTPENPDNRLSGTLSFDPQSGIELELVGTLVESRSHDNIHEPKFILGLTADGKTITLYHSYESSRPMHLPGIPTCKYVVQYVLSGAHFEREEDFVFHSVRGRLRNLETWISKFGFSVVETDFTSKLKFQANFAASSFCFPCYGWVYEQNHGYILFINVVTKNTLAYRI